MVNLQACADALKKHKFDVKLFKTPLEVTEALLKEIGDQSVGFGGSMTIHSTGIYETLQKRGNKVFWHWYIPEGETMDGIVDMAAHADVYLCSTNAVTEDGTLINIDGRGNRVAAMAYGPKRVIMVVGRNKIAKNNQEALARIHAVACPANARRLNVKTPCAVDKCTDCDSPQRMCNVVTYTQYPPHCHPVSVYFVDADMGY